MYKKLLSKRNKQDFVNHKIYRNALNRTIERAKQDYCYIKFRKQKQLRDIWEIIFNLKNTNKRPTTFRSKLKISENKTVILKTDVVDNQNDYFVEIRQEMAEAILLVNTSQHTLAPFSGSLSNFIFLYLLPFKMWVT